MTSYDFAHSGCSWCHPGGGALEYDREGYRYDGNVLGSGLNQTGPNPSPKNGDYFIFGIAAGPAASYAGAGYFEVTSTKGIMAPDTAINQGTMKWVNSGGGVMKQVGKKYNSWVAGGVAEADCLMCHYANQYSQVDRNWAAPGYTMPKWSASLGLVGAKGQAGLLTPGTKAGDGINPALGTPNWASNTVAADMIVKAPKNEGCSACHFFDNAFTDKGPAGKPMGNTAWQKKIVAGSFPDADIGPLNSSYNAGNNIVDWLVAKGKPEGGKRAESINDPNNPDAHMSAAPVGGAMTCSMCHYNLSGAFPALMDNGNTIYPAITVQKIDHQFAKGDNLPDGKNLDNLDNTVTCASCHTTRTHPNITGNGGSLVSPTPAHAGFPAIHFAKLDCRVCHIPVLNAKSIWKVADFTVGPYRSFERNQAPENSLGVNAKPLLIWRKSSTSDTIMLEPTNTTVVPVWTDNSILKPTYQRVAKSAAEAKRAADGYNGSGVANWPLNQAQGGDTTLIVNTTAEITDMVGRINAGAGISSAVMNFYINAFDVSHNVMPKGGKCVDRTSVGGGTTCNYILGSIEGGGCVMCHSSSNSLSPNYNSKSVGFFDRTHTLFANPVETDSTCSNTPGVHQTTIGGVKRVEVKLATIKSDGTPNTIDLSNVADCTPVGNTLDQGAVLGYTSTKLANLMGTTGADCTACHTQKMTTLNHPAGTGTPTACTTCHTGVDSQHGFDLAAGLHPTLPTKIPADFITATACGQCHQGTKPPAFAIDTPTLVQAAAAIHKSSVNGSPVMPAGAGVAMCNAVSVNRTIGGTTDSFTVGDNPPSTINGGLSGKVFIDWGDGSALQTMTIGATTTPGHTYANTGFYKIRKTVQDGDPAVKGSSFGVSCYSETEVQVSNLARTGFGTFKLTAQTCNQYACSNNHTLACTVDSDCGTGNTCSFVMTPGGAALTGLNQYVNVYMVGKPLTAVDHLSFHGVTDTTTGIANLPTIAGTMPSAATGYNMTVFGPGGKVCYTAVTCSAAQIVNNPSKTESVPGSDTVFCK